MGVSLGLAFLAGLASFLSPCVFALVPAYVGYLGGRSAANAEENRGQRWRTFGHGLAFVLGFSLVFITLGAAASALGSLRSDLRFVLSKAGGIVVVVFGVHMTGLVRIPFLEFDLRPQNKNERNLGYLSSALMGVFFSAGWSPCIGPVLGSILTLAMSGGSILEGIRLLSAYSAGMAIPFLIAALGIGWVGEILRRYGKVMHYVEVAMGVILIGVGLLLFFGVLDQLARYGWGLNFGL